MKIAEERLTRLSTFIGKYDLLPLNQDILQFLEDIEESNSVTLYEMMVLYLKIAALSNKLKEDELSETQVETVSQINKNEFMHQEFVKKKLKQVKECIEGLEIPSTEIDAIYKNKLIKEVHNFLTSSLKTSPKITNVINVTLKRKKTHISCTPNKNDNLLKETESISPPIMNIKAAESLLTSSESDQTSQEDILIKCIKEEDEGREKEERDYYQRQQDYQKPHYQQQYLQLQQQQQQVNSVAICPDLKKVISKVQRCNSKSKNVLENDPAYNKILNAFHCVSAKTKFRRFRRHKDFFETSGMPSKKIDVISI